MANEEKWFHNALLVNRDGDWYRIMDAADAESTYNSLRSYFNGFGGYKITDVLLNVFEQSALLPNNKFQWLGSKYHQKLEDGIPVDYTENDQIKKLYKCFAEYGIDAAQLFIDTMRENDIRPWFTFRMNDLHYTQMSVPEYRTSYLRPDIFYEAQAAGEKLGSEYAEAAYAYDFKYPRYRNALLGCMEEYLLKYDVFGLELDFTRGLIYFDYKNEPECHKIMTEYIRKVRELTRAAGEKWGHDIKLTMRVCRDPEDALIFGFDVKTLCLEGLIDGVVPTSHFSCTDSAIPISKWRELVGEDIAVFGGMETRNIRTCVNTALNSKAYAAAFFAGGANGIYFNNHEYNIKRNNEAWMINRDTCHEGRREFVVTWQDVVPVGGKRYRPLPLIVELENSITLSVGKIKPSDKVTVIIDWGEGLGWARLVVGEKTYRATPCEPVYAPLDLVNKEPVAEKMITCDMPLKYDISGVETDNELTLKFTGRGTVHYINVIIEA